MQNFNIKEDKEFSLDSLDITWQPHGLCIFLWGAVDKEEAKRKEWKQFSFTSEAVPEPQSVKSFAHSVSHTPTWFFT